MASRRFCFGSFELLAGIILFCAGSGCRVDDVSEASKEVDDGEERINEEQRNEWLKYWVRFKSCGMEYAGHTGFYCRVQPGEFMERLGGGAGWCI